MTEEILEIETVNTDSPEIEDTPAPLPPKKPTIFVRVPIVRGFDKVYPYWLLWNEIAHFCGGYPRFCASPLVTPVEAGDFDVFPKDQEAYDRIVADCKRMGLTIGWESSVAVTYQSAPAGRFKDCPDLQIVKPVNQGAIVAQGSVEDILNNFDFTVVRAAIVSPQECLVDLDFIQDEATKKLNIKNIHCPIGSTLRFMKYAKKGYKAQASDVLELFKDWDARSKEYKDSLLEGIPKLQLSGEDALDEDERKKLATLIYID